MFTVKNVMHTHPDREKKSRFFFILAFFILAWEWNSFFKCSTRRNDLFDVFYLILFLYKYLYTTIKTGKKTNIKIIPPPFSIFAMFIFFFYCLSESSFLYFFSSFQHLHHFVSFCLFIFLYFLKVVASFLIIKNSVLLKSSQNHGKSGLLHNLDDYPGKKVKVENWWGINLKTKALRCV